jgi:hypothetical protein
VIIKPPGYVGIHKGLPLKSKVFEEYRCTVMQMGGINQSSFSI